MYAQTNQPYPNRIQIVLAPFVGPLVQDGPLGSFDPRRDLQVYVDGTPTTVQTFSFDAANDRYLLFTASTFDLQGVIQIVHHVPSPPFQASASPSLQVPGFAITASFSQQGDDTLPPQAQLFAVPSTTTPNQPIDLLWDTLNVAFIRVTGNIGSPPFNTGLIPTSGSGIYVVGSGFAETVTLTLQAYDATQTAIPGVTSRVTVIV
jgi:hypothetical protein